jgi:hypothetical protein
MPPPPEEGDLMEVGTPPPLLEDLPSPAEYGAGGFRVAQFVRIDRLPNHWPFI